MESLICLAELALSSVLFHIESSFIVNSEWKLTTESYTTKFSSGLIWRFWTPLEISESRLRPLYTIDYMDTFLCIIMEVNIYGICFNG